MADKPAGDFMREEEVADLIGRHIQTLRRNRANGTPIFPYIKVSPRCVLYNRRAVEETLRARAVEAVEVPNADAR